MPRCLQMLRINTLNRMPDIQTHALPRHLARRLHFYMVLGLWLGLVPMVVKAQTTPASKESVRQDHQHEIERVAGALDERNTSIEYLLYVILPLVGLIGVLSALRRWFQI
jgi:hypothetical protein